MDEKCLEEWTFSAVSFEEKQGAARLLGQLTKPAAAVDPRASLARQDQR
jgi:hypothetical protein